uniref:Reverse transcriptase RNase H-like domain-containing protein n=1 Tax=Lactuca sativa TaxID=4236 RepID=A0A9R1UU35_LACSA|nr:hypothetical protein LSAT_V11C800405410 [Lactuca sativa]
MKGKTFSWTGAAESTFQLVKRRSLHHQFLYCQIFFQVFELRTDVSKVTIRSVLSQGGRPISYFSEKLTRPKLRYSTYDVEFLVGAQVVKPQRSLFHKEFVLFTEHDSLRHVCSQDKGDGVPGLEVLVEKLIVDTYFFIIMKKKKYNLSRGPIF